MSGGAFYPFDFYKTTLFITFFCYIVGLLFSLVGFYGWLPFLIYGIAKRRKGEGGKWQLGVAGVWVCACVAFIIYRMTNFQEFNWYMLLGTLMFIAASAWLPLLMWGGARWWRKKTGGRWMTAGFGIWGVLVVSLVSYQVISINRTMARYASETFNPNTYTGEVAVVEFPYTGKVTVSATVYPKEGDTRGWHVSTMNTNRMVIPAGDYRMARAYVFLEGEGFSVSFDEFTVAPDEVFVFPGGFPLVASISIGEVKLADRQLGLDFKLVDAAGNKVNLSSSSGKKVGFEALTPDSREQFWRDDFGYS